jgi:hypothetical protein
MGTPYNQIDSLDVDEVEATIVSATTEAAIALGLVRVLTLLPFHDPALDEVEGRLAAAWQSLIEVRVLLAENRATSSGRQGGGRP